MGNKQAGTWTPEQHEQYRQMVLQSRGRTGYAPPQYHPGDQYHEHNPPPPGYAGPTAATYTHEHINPTLMNHFGGNPATYGGGFENQQYQQQQGTVPYFGSYGGPGFGGAPAATAYGPGGVGFGGGYPVPTYGAPTYTANYAAPYGAFNAFDGGFNPAAIGAPTYTRVL